MFNLKKSQRASEKYLREENIGPKADDNQTITEKELPHRTGDQYTVTEDQIKSEHEIGDKDDAIVIEKVLNEAKSYVSHRNDGTWLPVMPMQALVEKLRQKRAQDYWKPEKTSHWSQSYDEKKQQGSLPSWPKNTGQHDKIVLNNDPRRFETMNNLPTDTDQSKNDAARSNSNKITPLVGNISTADIDRVASMIKTGQSIDYDTAMVAILREAEMEKRELSPVEQKAISDLKQARTNKMLARE